MTELTHKTENADPSDVDSDPAIFKGHTSQDIISSSYVLGDPCLFTHYCIKQALCAHTAAEVIVLCVCVLSQAGKK